MFFQLVSRGPTVPRGLALWAKNRFPFLLSVPNIAAVQLFQAVDEGVHEFFQKLILYLGAQLVENFSVDF